MGFLYVLGNEQMPGLFKIGRTDRSPHARAAEVSMGTGVPARFEVLCYAEVLDPIRYEHLLHAHLHANRVNGNREFFANCLPEAVSWLWWCPARVSFCDVPGSQPFGETLLYRPGFEAHVREGAVDFNLLLNPWTEAARA